MEPGVSSAGNYHSLSQTNWIPGPFETRWAGVQGGGWTWEVLARKGDSVVEVDPNRLLWPAFYIPLGFPPLIILLASRYKKLKPQYKKITENDM